MTMPNDLLITSWRERWNRNLLRFLGRRVRTAVDIEDLAQETYLRLLRAPDLRQVRNPEAYLIRVASHIVAEWRESHPREDLQTTVEEDLLVDERTPELELDQRILQERFDHVLATFSPLTRAVLVLKLRDEQSSKEIAKLLNITERQVKRHLAHGYERLRRGLRF
jgi:RNA polymerase sigma-70 factor (ECF subfamily)